MDVLAAKLIPWEPMNHQERLALLAKRTGIAPQIADRSLDETLGWRISP
jgi:hypothetical protein